MTEQRELIYNTFIKMKGHRSIDDIYNECTKKGLRFGKTTIYRSMNLFVQLGLADILAIKNYPVMYEIKKEHHHHFVCTKCRNVFDIKGCAIHGYIPEGDFHISSHDIVFYGICDKCYKEGGKR